MAALLPVGLAFLMLVVGFRLNWKDFYGLWQRPAAVMTGLAAQMVALPLLAITISWLLALPPVLSLGLLVVAAAPGGITSNFITLIARGDAALSATMTLATSLAASLSIPLVLFFGQTDVTGGFNHLVFAVGKTGLAVTAVSAVPLLVGMLLRRHVPDLVERWAPLLERAATLIFFGLVLMAFHENWDAMMANAPTAGSASVLLNAAAIATAFAAGHFMRLPRRQTLAIAIECGLQNVAMAMFVATSILQNDSLMIPALVYAIVMNITALALLIGGRWALNESFVRNGAMPSAN